MSGYFYVNFKGGDELSEFKITMRTDLDDSVARQKLTKLIADAKKEPIKLTAGDTSSLESSLNKIAGLLEKIQSKSKSTKLGDTGAKKEEENVKSLIATYNKYMEMRRGIERQMSKTTNMQSYKVLEKELASVAKEADNVAKKLDSIPNKIGNKTITNSLANTFQGLNKQITSTISSMDSLFKNKTLNSSQFGNLSKLKADLQSIQNIRLDDILKSQKPYEEMSKLMRKTEEVRNSFRNLNIKIAFGDQINTATKNIDGLISKLQTLNKSGFSDTTGINNLINKLQSIKMQMSNIDPNTESARGEFENLKNLIVQCETQYKTLNSAMQSSKTNFKLDTQINKTLNDVQNLRKAYNELGASSNALDKIETDLNQLGNMSNDKAIASLQRLRSEISIVKSELKNMITDNNNAQKLQASYEKTFASISSKATTLGAKIQSAFNNPNINMGQLNSLQTRFQGLQNLIKNFDINKASGESLNNLLSKVTELQEKLIGLNTTANQTKLENKFNIDCSKTISELEKIRNKYVSLGKDTSGIDAMISEVQRLQSSVGTTNLGTLQNQLNNVNKQAMTLKSSLGGLSAGVKSTFGQIVSSFSMLAPGYLIGTSLIGGIRTMKEEVLNLDKAMTNLIKVADDSDVNTASKLKGITDNAITIARDVAGNVSDVVESMADATKMGIKGMDAVQEVAKYSQIFANVGDMNINAATQGIATVINAFDVDPLKEYSINVDGATKKTTELANAMDIMNHA